MSDTSEMRPPRARSKPFEIYVATSAIAFLVSYVATYVYSFYLQKMTFDSQFHPGADFPGSLIDPAVHDPNRYNVGVHFFGDFWTTLLRSMEPSPYLVRPGVGGSSYPPFAQFIYEPLTWIPYPIALTIFLVGTTALIVIPFWRALGAYEPHLRVLLIVVGVLLTYPFLFSLDRGNNIGLTVGFLLFGVLNLYEDRPQRAAVFFAIAAALKIYPVFFLLIFISRKQWRAFGTAVWTGGCITIIPLMTYSGGLVNNLRALYDNSGYFRDAGEQIALNHSLYSWFATLKSAVPTMNSFVQRLIDSYSMITLICMTCLALLVIVQKSRVNQVLLLSAMNVLFVPITYGYTLSVFLVVALTLVWQISSNSDLVIVAVGTGLLLSSKGLPIGPTGAAILNFVNPLLEVILVVYVALRYFINGQTADN